MTKIDIEYNRNLEGILESTEDAIIIKSLDGTIQSWNKGSEKMFGYTSKEMVGKITSLIIPPEFINNDKNNLRRISNNEIIDRYETVSFKKNGEELHVSVILSTLKDPAGIITGFYQVARDITFQKKSEAELIEAYKELAFQNSEKEKRAAAFHIANNELLYQTDQKAKRADELIIANKELAFQNEEKHKRAEELKIANKELAFQNEEKEKSAAELIIANNELAFQNEEKHKRAEELLNANMELVFLNKNQQALFASIVNSSDDAMMSKTLDGVITSWNYGAEKIFGYSADEIIGKNVLILIPPELQQKEVDIAKKILTGETVNYYETRRIKKDGASFHASLTISPIRNFEGNIIGAAKVLRDITEQNKSEAEKYQLTKRLLLATKSAQMGIWDWDLENDTLGWDEEMYKLFNIASNEFNSVYDAWISRIHKEDSQRVANELQLAIANEKDYNTAFRVVWADASVHYIKATGLVERDDDGKAKSMIGANWDITENVNVLKKIEAKEQFNKTVIESSPDCLKILDSDGRLLDMNYNGLCQMEIDDFSEFKNKQWWLLWGPENETLVRESVEKALKGETVQFSAFCPTAKGTPKWWDVTVSPVLKFGEPIQNIISVSRDITAKKVEEQRLKLLESVVTNTTDAIMITEAEPFDEPGHKIVFVNEAFTKMTGYTSEEIIGKTPRILQGPKSDKAELKRFSETIRKWQHCEITTVNYKKNGEEYWVNFSVSPVANEQGYYTHWISIERDVTEQKLVEIQLNELNDNLKKQAKKLALSNTELEQFAYVASHDLQEPLRMITNFLTQLEKKYGDIIDDTGKKYIGFAVDGAKRMRQIILDLLEYSKIGETEEEKEKLDLNKLIDEIKILLRKKIAEKEAVFFIDQLPKIYIYRSPMHQVFQNLIINALKYSNKEMPVQIHITVKELEHHWQFAVSDNGIGIEKEYLDKIFIIFQRLHNKEQYSGTGMGLAIVKKIIETQGGRIWVESEYGKGSTFYFTIKK